MCVCVLVAMQCTYMCVRGPNLIARLSLMARPVYVWRTQQALIASLFTVGYKYIYGSFYSLLKTRGALSDTHTLITLRAVKRMGVWLACKMEDADRGQIRDTPTCPALVFGTHWMSRNHAIGLPGCGTARRQSALCLHMKINTTVGYLLNSLCRVTLHRSACYKHHSCHPKGKKNKLASALSAGIVSYCAPVQQHCQLTSREPHSALFSCNVEPEISLFLHLGFLSRSPRLSGGSPCAKTPSYSTKLTSHCQLWLGYRAYAPYMPFYVCMMLEGAVKCARHTVQVYMHADTNVSA